MPAIGVLIVRAQSGDRRALRRLVDEHGPLVWSLARRLAAEPEHAHQEIWEEVLRALPRVESHEGSPGPWPEDLPPAWAPAAFEANLRSPVEAGGMTDQLLSVDCSEFPCLALIEAAPDASEDARFDDVHALIERLKADGALGEAAAMLQGMVTRDDEGEHAVAGLALAPPDQLDPELQARLGYRLREAGEDARDEPAEQDEDVPLR